MDEYVVNRNKKEAYFALLFGIFSSYFGFCTSNDIWTLFFWAGIVSIVRGGYSLFLPLASLKNQHLYVNCRLLNTVKIDLSKVTSIHSSGPGIYPKNFHFDIGGKIISINPNFSMIQNDGMVLSKFLENLGHDISHVSETAHGN